MKRKVLMSIKPKYVDEILKGTKLFEFRKTVFDYSNIDSVVIYASSPVKMIVGEFNVDDVLIDNPKSLWERCHEHSGIDKESFMKYFENKDKAFSIVIKNLTIYKKPINPYKEITNFRPPQSYMYFNDKLDSIFNH